MAVDVDVAQIRLIQLPPDLSLELIEDFVLLVLGLEHLIVYLVDESMVADFVVDSVSCLNDVLELVTGVFFV